MSDGHGVREGGGDCAARVGGTVAGALVENALDLLAVVGPDGRLRYLNRAVERYGTDPRSLEGCSLFEIAEAAYRRELEEGVRRAIAQPGNPIPVAYAVLRFGEGERGVMHAEIQLRAGSEALGDGGVALSARDISELVRVEREMHVANVRLRFEATTDPLTGLYNRRRGLALLESELVRARRTKQVLSLILMDIDYFKNVNDAHGHGAGDAVLVELAARLKRRCRRYDAIVRWGGEELLIICPHTGSAEITAAAERFHEAVAFAPVLLPSGTPISITASLGTASTDSFPGRGAKELIELADEALYLAKSEGRNTIRVSTTGSP